MNDGLKFGVEWTDVAVDPAAARIQIDVAGKNACRAENRWSRTIDEAPHLSALPIATWLASSWWRLRWEGDPKSGRRDADWRMAHELAAAGHGFIWPRLTFVSDGLTMRAECNPSDDNSLEVLRYISRFETTISAAAFEAGVDEFVQLVVERGGGEQFTLELRRIWDEVLSERQDEEASRYRRLEAMLGFDPDEAPSSVVDRLVGSGATAGEAAVDEVAAFCRSDNPEPELAAILELGRDSGFLKGRVARDLVSQTHATLDLDQTHELARVVRKAQGVGTRGPVADKKLAEMLGLSEVQLTSSQASRYPIGLAISQQGQGDKIFFRNWRPLQRRFEASRLFYDEITQVNDFWHPVTQTFTYRQKAQRAFSAELLAPIESLVEYLRGDYSIDAIEGAAEYHDVSWQLVGSHLANNGVINRNHPAVPIRQ